MQDVRGSLQLNPHHPGFFDLPLELKEEIYEYCLVDVSPPTYVVYKHAQASNWSFRRGQDGRIPALLLVCRTIRTEVLNVLYRTTEGLVLHTSPHTGLKRRTTAFKTCLFDKADEMQSVFDLEPVLSSARKLKLELNLPSSFVEQGWILGLLRWMVVVLNARTQPIGRLHVDIVLESRELWPKEKDGIWQVLGRIACEELAVVCEWRQDREHPWEREEVEWMPGRKVGDVGESEQEVDEKLLAAREALLASCRVRKCTLGDTAFDRRSVTIFRGCIVCLALLGEQLIPKIFGRWSR